MFETPTVFESPTGARLALRSRPAEGPARGIVLLQHGLAEHSGRYGRFAADLSRLGFHIYAHDHRGHGGTSASGAPPRRFAAANGIEALLADAQAVEALARRAHPGLPMVVFGHSMGGLVAMALASRIGAGLAGVCVWNSDLEPGPDLHLARLLFRLERAYRGSDVASELFARLTFRPWSRSVANRRSEADWLSHDADAVARYEADPLCGWTPTVSMAADLVALKRLAGAAATLAGLPSSLPLHLLGGGGDPATKGGSRVERLAARLGRTGAGDVTCLVVPGARHETLNEIEAYRAPALASLGAWLDRVVPPVSAR